jgi:hypothetical protein
VIEAEAYNLAPEYIKGRSEPNPELGYPVLTLQEYVGLVRQVGRYARTYHEGTDPGGIVPG